MNSSMYVKLNSVRQEQNAVEEEENFLNLWSYLRRRHPDINLENKNFYDLIHLKNDMEGPRELRQSDGEIATSRKL